jgi:hypothetical protein
MDRYRTINPQFTAFSHTLPLAFNGASRRQAIVRLAGQTWSIEEKRRCLRFK